MIVVKVKCYACGKTETRRIPGYEYVRDWYASVLVLCSKCNSDDIQLFDQTEAKQ